MASKEDEGLRDRVQSALLREAIFRPESAMVISISLLLAVFAPQVGFLEFIPFWAWLLGGLAAEGALVYSSLTDPEFGRKVAEDVLNKEFEPQKLQDRYLQERMDEALDYRVRIEKAIRQQDDSLIKDELSQTAAQMDEWLEHIYNLASRIDRYRQEKDVLERDYNRTNRRIGELEKQLAVEQNPKIREQITDNLESKKQQLATLEKLNDTIRRAELQFENSHTQLGTIYSQTMLVDAKDIDSGQARRLRLEISGEVDEIQDILSAMDEVYAANAQRG
ncbi:MAG: hypothetical protein AB8I52_08610 [Candidatus Promineifilaceae bacterium]|jgi:hypothetical protein